MQLLSPEVSLCFRKIWQKLYTNEPFSERALKGSELGGGLFVSPPQIKKTTNRSDKG